MNPSPPLLRILAAALGLSAIAPPTPAGDPPAHPRLLAEPGDRTAILRKLEDHPWAQRGLRELRKRVDPIAGKVADDPDWLSSRLLMNWETHYTLPITEDSRWIGGEGRAPVPTPRFAGARDWKTDYGLPQSLDDWTPRNGWGDQLWLNNKLTGEHEWVHPSITGLTIERGNQRIMQLAGEAAFLFWLTREERYAKVAVPVLWTYMEGFSHVLPPRVVDDDETSEKIIGTTSFEVIHEDILVHISRCYDFTYHYLVETGRDPRLIQNGIKRMVDRIIAGGQRDGNWNLFQAKFIAHGGMVLEPDSRYPDGKGHEYYLDVMLSADLPNQLGLLKVVEAGYDPETALWPEAPGYAFETTASILDIASLVSIDPKGAALLQNPLLEKAVMAQLELLHPNGLSVGIGDTPNARVSAHSLELLIADARKRGDVKSEDRLTAVLQNEIADKRYRRDRLSRVPNLTLYVGKLRDATEAGIGSRSYFGAPLDVLMLRLPAKDRTRSLSAAMYGTAGGHAHANGLAIELYGAGHILGADPGRGTSYWQRDQRYYYSRMPAHNTVIPKGNTLYHTEPPHQIASSPGPREPAPGTPHVSNRIGFARAGFHHTRPTAVQQRTLALVRSGNNGGFYFDVFRSRLSTPSDDEFHDYLYHGMGQAASLTRPDGTALPLEPCELLGETHGHMPGYDYFREEQSAVCADNFRARFTLTLPDGSSPTMHAWVPGAPNRRIFSVQAPPNRAIRNNLPSKISTLPMPTLLIRQSGSAWDTPFVAVYEPSTDKDRAGVRSVRHARPDVPTPGMAAVVVDETGSRTLLMAPRDEGAPCQVEGVTFSGNLGVVIGRPGHIDELYLGHGKTIGFQGLRVTASGPAPVSASLYRDAAGRWQCRSTGPVDIETPGSETLVLPPVFHATTKPSR